MTNQPAPWGEYTVRRGDLSPALADALLQLDAVERQIETWTTYVDTVKEKLKAELLLIKPYVVPVHTAPTVANHRPEDVLPDIALPGVARVNARIYILPPELLGADKGRSLSYSAGERLDVKALRATVPDNLLREFYVPQSSWKLVKRR